jgi:hypothetical protein
MSTSDWNEQIYLIDNSITEGQIRYFLSPFRDVIRCFNNKELLVSETYAHICSVFYVCACVYTINLIFCDIT